jgi:1,2-diacylglycerol 3-alpha-glucosyltransferase
MNDNTRVAIVVFNLGPYHVARARALAQVPGLQPCVIEITSQLGSHPWITNRENIGFVLRTLSHRPFESCSYRELTGPLVEALETIEPDVVITTSFRPFIMLRAARWARRRGKPAAFFYETTPWDRPRYRLGEHLKRWLIKRYYTGSFVGGTVHRNYLMQLGMPKHRIWMPYDVVDNAHFSACASQVRPNAESWRAQLQLPARYFLYVGRLAPEKNLLRLLEAFKRYRSRQTNTWSLVIVGDGPQRSELVNAARTELDGAIVFRAFQQADIIPAYYALAQCLILPSIVDPWGLVVNEALACGLPVLVSNRCGSGFDLVDEGHNGFRFDPYDISELANLLNDFSTQPRECLQSMSTHAKRIVSDYCPEAWADGLASCIKSIV